VDCWLVDPLAIEGSEPLRDLLQNASVLKAIHSCSEDLQVLEHALQIIPQPLFDTQVAAAFVGMGFSLGYSKLVEAVTGLKLPKHETRSDWLRRPLSESQLNYAAEDVFHLPEIYRRLCDLLVRNNRLDWLAEDMVQLIKTVREADDATLYYQRIKAAWQLDASQLKVLARLARWREEEARRLDRPRTWVMGDPVLLKLATVRPVNGRELAQVEGMTARQLRIVGDRILALVREGAGSDESIEILPQPLPRSAESLLRSLRKAVNEIAHNQDIAPEILARRKDLESVVRISREKGHPQLPDNLADGWRYSVIGKKLLEIVSTSNNSS